MTGVDRCFPYLFEFPSWYLHLIWPSVLLTKVDGLYSLQGDITTCLLSLSSKLDYYRSGPHLPQEGEDCENNEKRVKNHMIIGGITRESQKGLGVHKSRFRTRVNKCGRFTYVQMDHWSEFSQRKTRN